MKKIFYAVLILLALVNLALGVFYLRLRKGKQSVVAFACPVPKHYCSKGKQVLVNNKHYGIGWQVPEGTPVYSIIAGKGLAARAGIYPRYSHPALTLESMDGRWRVVYVFTGPDTDWHVPVDKTGVELFRVRKGRIGDTKVNVVVRVYQMLGVQETLITNPQFDPTQ